MLIAPRNTDQARAWNGRDGDLWTIHDDHYNAAVRRHSARLLAAAHIRAADRVLDIGCGCGETTREAARLATTGSALGVDLSAPMLRQATDRGAADGLANIAFLQADAEVHPFDVASFDVAISRFGTMFFGDPIAAFTNIGRALRPGGRLAMLTWRELACNEWVRALRDALAIEAPPQVDGPAPATPDDGPGPFSLAQPARVRRILTLAGFHHIRLIDVTEPVSLGTDVDDAAQFVRGVGFVTSTLDDLDAARAALVVTRLRSTLTAHLTADGVVFGSCAWLITAYHG